MKSQAPPPPNATDSRRQKWFAVLAGLILGLALLKFTNPDIFRNVAGLETFQNPESQRESPWVDVILGPWPIYWGYTGVALLLGVSFFTTWKWRLTAPSWLAAMPLAWLLWQLMASMASIRPDLTSPILKHFCSCVVWFYLGLFAMGTVRRPGWLLGPVTVAFSLVMASGWEQHWFGLEATRQFFYELPNWQEFPPEFLAKLASNRIYATLFYPNALAGAILLLLPVTLAWVWEWTKRWEFSARVVLAGLLALGSLACLYWSQSKAGWLILLAMSGVVFLHLPLSRKVKVGLVAAILILGVGAFLIRYAGYFSRGATSVVARVDYWRAALDGASTHPFLGTGPGTFMVHYAKVKAPEAEMARLAHNDYLQQACDSGWAGAILYLLFVWGTLLYLFRQPSVRQSLLRSALWLGLFGMSLQSVVEFGLYLPALAWPFFFFLGWLLCSKHLDRLPPE